MYEILVAVGVAMSVSASATVGVLLADLRGRDRRQAAVICGVLGPIGWLVLALGPDFRER